MGSAHSENILMEVAANGGGPAYQARLGIDGVANGKDRQTFASMACKKGKLVIFTIRFLNSTYYEKLAGFRVSSVYHHTKHHLLSFSR